MTARPDVEVHRDADHLIESVAAALLDRIVALQHQQQTVSVALTGGRVGTAVLRRVAETAGTSSVDWGRVDLWWGDERFLPPGDPDRNETQARAALVDHVVIPPHRVHPMAADAPPFSGDPEAAAAAYAEELTAGVPDGLDIVLLGVGPDGHIASLFPGHPGLADERPVVAVRDSPKPPPTRISLGLSTIRAASEVWLVVAGDDKASAVARALSPTHDDRLPAADAVGTRVTRWLVDASAASSLRT